jgi:demethylspheroidene O-methyltransferase
MACIDSPKAAPMANADAPVLGLRALWRQRWCAWRDSRLANPDFRRRASRSLLTRFIARRRARALFDLVAGFVYSQVLFACVRLRAFEILAEGPQTGAALARRFDMPLDAAERLLAAAVALELVEARDGGCYGLGPLGAPLVGNEAVTAMVEHHAVLYADLQDPVALLRGIGHAPALSRYWAYATADAPRALPGSEVSDYSALMSASQPLVALEVLDTYPLTGHRCLLDVGGGEGRFLIAAGLQTPALRLMLFDLPAVVSKAAAAFTGGGLAGRAQVFGGDFCRDPLPKGADIVSLVRVIYDHSDERALVILRAVHRALPAGGTLLLAEPMAGARDAPRMGDAYFGMYLLAMRGGRARTAKELTALLQASGFEQVRELATPVPLQVGVIVAKRSSSSLSGLPGVNRA